MVLDGVLTTAAGGAGNTGTQLPGSYLHLTAARPGVEKIVNQGYVEKCRMLWVAVPGHQQCSIARRL
jgi:hypothetical protein